MPRHKGDHDARRRDVSAAVWRVLARQGFHGLTLRAVAAEMGATTGLVTHYFPSKRDLVDHALTLLDERRAAQPGTDAAPGIATIRSLLLDILPLTPSTAADNRIWVSSWDPALADSELTAGHARRYARSRERIAEQVRTAQHRGELPPSDPDDTAAILLAFVLGLIVQALLDVSEFAPARQVRILDGYLDAMRHAPGHRERSIT